MPTCAVEGCERPTAARGWCDRHYRRWRNHGDPLGGEPRGLTAEERFWAKVDKTNDCWLWTASRLPDGYGSFWDGTWRRPRVPRMVRSHRWIYEQTFGPIPEGLEVCHSCDTPPCVNSGHLFLGTHGVNMADSARKGRQGRNRGQRNGRARLTAVDVEAIRNTATGRYGERSAFAREYGVSTATISKVLNGNTWGEQ